MKSAQNTGSFFEKTSKKDEHRYKIELLLSKSYFEDLSRVSFSFCVDLEYFRTAKVAIFSDSKCFLIIFSIFFLRAPQRVPLEPQVQNRHGHIERDGEKERERESASE